MTFQKGFPCILMNGKLAGVSVTVCMKSCCLFTQVYVDVFNHFFHIQLLILTIPTIWCSKGSYFVKAGMIPLFFTLSGWGKRETEAGRIPEVFELPKVTHSGKVYTARG